MFLKSSNLFNHHKINIFLLQFKEEDLKWQHKIKQHKEELDKLN